MTDNYSLDIEATKEQSSYIKVIGVGGAGTNAVNHMYNKGITGVDFLICNTDEQSLNASPVDNKIKIGEGGLGAGNNPEVAKNAAIAAADTIKNALTTNTHMLFITAGMGGGTGTGASPEIAKIAKEVEVDGGKDEILVIGVVTIPFSFEGRKRREQAKAGIENLRKVVDAIIVINTDKLKTRGNMSMKSAFALADDVLLTAAKGIAEIMTSNAYIHVDFKDVQSIMRHSGVALMGSGVGEGEDRAFEAIKAAATSDLLNDNDLSKTKNILLYLSFSSKEEYQLQMEEMDTITQYIQEQTNSDVDMIWGYGYDDTLEGKLTITLVATGFESQEIYNDGVRSVVAEKKIEHTLPPLEKVTPSDILKQVIEEKQELKPIEDTQEKKEVKDILDFTLSNPNEKQEKEDDTKEQGGKKVIGSLDEGLYGNDEVVSQKAQDDLTQDEAFKILSEQSLANQNEPIKTITIEQDKKEDISLNDIIASPVEKNDKVEITPTDRIRKREERMKRLHELFKSEKGIETIESLHPVCDDIDRVLSKESSKSSQFSFSDKGGLKITENKAINSSVD